jgi:hypothetical protein
MGQIVSRGKLSHLAIFQMIPAAWLCALPPPPGLKLRNHRGTHGPGGGSGGAAQAPLLGGEDSHPQQHGGIPKFVTMPMCSIVHAPPPQKDEKQVVWSINSFAYVV